MFPTPIGQMFHLSPDHNHSITRVKLNKSRTQSQTGPETSKRILGTNKASSTSNKTNRRAIIKNGVPNKLDIFKLSNPDSRAVKLLEENFH
jgi:hypothetical protein